MHHNYSWKSYSAVNEERPNHVLQANGGIPLPFQSPRRVAPSRSGCKSDALVAAVAELGR